MVLEALAAVGLAGNIVQFIDFSCQLFSTTVSIHRSSADCFQELESITHDLHRWCEQVSSSRHGPQFPWLSKQSLVKLARDCEVAASDLSSAVQALKAKRPSSKWSSFKAALATVWNESRVKDMEQRLNSYRLQLILELSSMQSDNYGSIVTLLNDLGDKNREIGADLTKQISCLKTDVKQAIETLRKDLEAIQLPTVEGIISSTETQTEPSKVHINLAKTQTRTRPIDPKALATMLTNFQSYTINVATSLTVLESLIFKQMAFRHSQIHEAHPKTFEWMFEKKFRPWLQSSEKIFWVSGKPGSGKSTLMKYLVDNSKTPIILNCWSGSNRLVIVDYFFWINGTEMQRSQEGLLRSLLYDILRQCPDLIMDLLPETWNRISNSYNSGSPREWGSWEKRQLLEIFERLPTLESTREISICIFIDGLDEYDGYHEELIETIRHLTKLNIKLCIASRPWNIFEDAFGSSLNQKLYLQDLNKPDIQLYVKDKLNTCPNFQQMDVKQAAEIVDEIVQKAQGVFLWVYLVVRSLVEGLRNRDSLSLLRNRLRDFPTDLNQFFSHIFLSLDPIYRTHLSHMLQIALRYNGYISPIAYWFLDEVEDDPDIASKMACSGVSHEDIIYRVDEAAVRINGRSKGLLEVIINGQSHHRLSRKENQGSIDVGRYINSRVHFLHRTVSDFLNTEMQQILNSWRNPAFNPSITLCSIILAELKYVALTPFVLRTSKRINDLIIVFMSVARGLESTWSMCINHLDELNRTFTAHLSARAPNLRNTVGASACSSFMELAVMFGMPVYITTRMESAPISRDKMAQLLMDILSNNSTWDYVIFSYGVPRKHMLDCISNGIHTVLSQGPLVKVDKGLSEALNRRLIKLPPEAIIEIVKIFLKHSLIEIDTSGNIKSESLQELLSNKLSTQQLNDIRTSLSNSTKSATEISNSPLASLSTMDSVQRVSDTEQQSSSNSTGDGVLVTESHQRSKSFKQRTTTSSIDAVNTNATSKRRSFRGKVQSLVQKLL